VAPGQVPDSGLEEPALAPKIVVDLPVVHARPLGDVAHRDAAGAHLAQQFARRLDERRLDGVASGGFLRGGRVGGMGCAHGGTGLFAARRPGELAGRSRIC